MAKGQVGGAGMLSNPAAFGRRGVVVDRARAEHGVGEVLHRPPLHHHLGRAGGCPMIPLSTSSIDAASSATVASCPRPPSFPDQSLVAGAGPAGAAPKGSGAARTAQSSPRAAHPRSDTMATVPAMPDFFEVVLTQRAARSFLPDDVDDETVARILTAATHTERREQPALRVRRRARPRRPAAIGELTARIWQAGPGRSRSSASPPPSCATSTAAPWAASPAPRSSWSCAVTPG